MANKIFRLFKKQKNKSGLFIQLIRQTLLIGHTLAGTGKVQILLCSAAVCVFVGLHGGNK